MKKKYKLCSDCKFFKFQLAYDLNTKDLEGDVFESYSISNPEEKSQAELNSLKEEHRILHHDMQISGFCVPKIQMCQNKECFDKIMMMPLMWRMVRGQGQGQLNQDGRCLYYKPKKFLFIKRLFHRVKRVLSDFRMWLKRSL